MVKHASQKMLEEEDNFLFATACTDGTLQGRGLGLSSFPKCARSQPCLTFFIQ